MFPVVYRSLDDKLHIKIHVGDVFHCNRDSIGLFDAIWDCNNSIGVINPNDRSAYMLLLMELLKPTGRILMTVYEHDQILRPRPPYAITFNTVQSLLPNDKPCLIKLITTIDVPLEEATTEVNKFNFQMIKRHVIFCQLKLENNLMK